jgi:hypothetical protein
MRQQTQSVPDAFLTGGPEVRPPERMSPDLFQLSGIKNITGIFR